MKIETAVRAGIALGREVLHTSSWTHVEILTEVPRDGYVWSFKNSKNASADDLVNREKIRLEVFEDGEGDRILVGYGPNTDTLVIADFRPEGLIRFFCAACLILGRETSIRAEGIQAACFAGWRVPRGIDTPVTPCGKVLLICPKCAERLGKERGP